MNKEKKNLEVKIQELDDVRQSIGGSDMVMVD